MHVPPIIFATVAFGKERSSSVGGAPECPSRSDIVTAMPRKVLPNKAVHKDKTSRETREINFELSHWSRFQSPTLPRVSLINTPSLSKYGCSE